MRRLQPRSSARGERKMGVWSDAATPKGSAGTPRRGRRSERLKCGSESCRAPGGLIQTGRKRLLPRTGEVLGNLPRKSPQSDPPSDCYAGLHVVGAGCGDAGAPADRSRCVGRSGRLGNCTGQTGPGAPRELASCFATFLSSGSFAMRACRVYRCPGILRAGLSAHWRASPQGRQALLLAAARC